MAEEVNEASQAPILTPRDVEILICAFRSPKAEGDFEASSSPIFSIQRIH
jgi:hypothetical protein